MIFFFSGYGLFTAAIGILSFLLTYTADIELGDGVFDELDWFLAMFNAALINFIMCRFIKKRKAKGNYTGGAKLLINQRHSLFFLPISLWTYLYLLAGIYYSYLQPLIYGPEVATP